MSTTVQILLGSVILGLCSFLHIVILVTWVGMMRRLGTRFVSFSHWGFVTGIGFVAVVFAHTVQVWVWAFSFILLGALNEMGEAIYFALSTYTTLGYGDVILGREHRTFAAMAAVTGLLNIGLSTAFLVGMFSKMLQNPLSGEE